MSLWTWALALVGLVLVARLFWRRTIDGRDVLLLAVWVFVWLALPSEEEMVRGFRAWFR